MQEEQVNLTETWVIFFLVDICQENIKCMQIPTITRVNSLFYHQIVNSNQMIDQARQSDTDRDSTAVTFRALSSPDFVHGISRAFGISLTVCALSPKTTSKWKKDFVIKLSWFLHAF